MGWEYDQPPLEYLKRRALYYKKKIGTVKNFVNQKHLIEKYGKKKLKEVISIRLKDLEGLKTQFEQAIEKLKL